MSRFFVFDVLLIISNFIVGKAAIPLFAVDFYLGLGVYLSSRLMLGAGVSISGNPAWDLT